MDMASIPASPVRSTPAACFLRKRSSYSRAIRFFQQSALLLVVLAMSIGSYYAISHFLLQSVEVVGSSMQPTLKEKGHYLLNRWTFRNREPKRNDVVVIRDPGDHGFSVKRVVAVEGESIHFKDGKVYVDGRELQEPYLLPGTHTFTYTRVHEQFITCGKGQYFVLGDNRLVSVDSRSYGPVSREDILGLVMLN